MKWLLLPFLAAPPTSASALPITLAIDNSAPSLAAAHPTNPLLLSCHCDLGYVHAAWSLYANLIYGSAFDFHSLWLPRVSGGGVLHSALDPAAPYFGQPTMSLTYSGGAGSGAAFSAGLVNRGMGNEGLFLRAGRAHEGFVIARSDAPTTLVVALLESATNASLAQATLALPGGGAWTNLSFILAPLPRGADCAAIAPGSVRGIDCGEVWAPDHICVQCGGEVLVGFAPSVTAAAAHVAYAYVQPEASARFAGLPVRAEGVDNLRAMGVRGIRVGGTYAQNVYWKDWRGRPETRAARNFYAGQGNLIGGFGLFEMLDLTAAMGIEAVVTISRNHTPGDIADLVEYCYGNATSPWGAIRALNDSHPAPFFLRGLELGNEDSNDDFVAQIEAAEAKAAALGLPPSQLYYLYPENGLHAGDVAALQAAGFPPAKVAADVHVGWGGGLAGIEAGFAQYRDFNASGINCETNGMVHSVGRALGEALDLLQFEAAPAAVAARVRGRFVSFCNERSGHFTRYDQGASMWLPNGTWLQPPGWVHAMASQTTGEVVLPVASAGSGAGAAPPIPAALGFSASAARNGSAVFVHIASTLNASQSVVVQLAAGAGSAAAWALCAPGGDLNASNPPGDALRVSPRSMPAVAAGAPFELPPQCFMTLAFAL